MLELQPFSKLAHVHSGKELLDIAFRRASKSASSLSFKRGTPPIVMAKAREITRVRTAGDILYHRLQKIVKSFPSIDSLEGFYRDFIDIFYGIDNFKRILGSIYKASFIIKKLQRRYIRLIKRAQTPEEARRLCIQAYGRMSSVINMISDRLDFLAEAFKTLKSLPAVDLSVPRIVVSGYPNVGKSTFVSRVSSASPEVAEYPFTTKNVIVGCIYRDSRKICQVIDTPGLLDRPISERNVLEKQAISAIIYLANLILFIMDPSMSSGYTIEEQMNLLREIESYSRDRPVIVVLNKIDIVDEKTLKKVKEELGKREVLEMSALLGKNVDKVIERALEIINEVKGVGK